MKNLVYFLSLLLLASCNGKGQQFVSTTQERTITQNGLSVKFRIENKDEMDISGKGINIKRMVGFSIQMILSGDTSLIESNYTLKKAPDAAQMQSILNGIRVQISKDKQHLAYWRMDSERENSNLLEKAKDKIKQKVKPKQTTTKRLLNMGISEYVVLFHILPKGYKFTSADYDSVYSLSDTATYNINTLPSSVEMATKEIEKIDFSVRNSSNYYLWREVAKIQSESRLDAKLLDLIDIEIRGTYADDFMEILAARAKKNSGASPEFRTLLDTKIKTLASVDLKNDMKLCSNIVLLCIATENTSLEQSIYQQVKPILFPNQIGFIRSRFERFPKIMQTEILTQAENDIIQKKEVQHIYIGELVEEHSTCAKIKEINKQIAKPLKLRKGCR